MESTYKCVVPTLITIEPCGLAKPSKAMPLWGKDCVLGGSEHRSSRDPKARDKFDGTCVLVGERVRGGMTSSDERVATLKLQ